MDIARLSSSSSSSQRNNNNNNNVQPPSPPRAETLLRGVEQDETSISIPFGQLFDDEQVTQYYQALVGTLLTAKKRGYVEFPGQMLLKGTHDAVPIVVTAAGRRILQQQQQQQWNASNQETATTSDTTTTTTKDRALPNMTTTHNSNQPQEQTEATTTPTPVPSFLDALSASTRTRTTRCLDAFLVTHVPHRPVALVTSGGTAVDLEQRTVRTLENFSTGWRGAVAVELLLRQGYAVLHLQRTGSTAPFARILLEECSSSSSGGGSSAPHQGLSLETLDRLVARGDDDDDDDNDNDEKNDYNQNNLDEYWETARKPSDPWLTGTENNVSNDSVADEYCYPGGDTASELHLRRNLVHSSRLQKAIRERQATKGRLLTIPFRTVQEYLAMVELCTTSLQATAGAQALLVMAAAVSDFYLPNPTQHKIQSGATDSLVLELPGVPKTLGTVRRNWAPDAFLVSFKLETDESILLQKASRAMEKYGVHMVVGNLLHTRYDQVHLLFSPKDEFTTLDKPSGGHNKEALEELLLEAIIEAHFAHMSGQGPPKLSSALKAKQVKLQRQHWWQRGRQVFWELTGVAISLLLSYGINRLVLRQPRVRY